MTSPTAAPSAGAARLTLAWLCLVTLDAAACERNDAEVERWAGTMRDSAGIVVVENEDVPLWREGDAWSFTKLVRIGVREGDPRYQFGSTTGLVVLSDGRVVVADAMAHTIRFFSPEGTYLHELGRERSASRSDRPSHWEVPMPRLSAEHAAETAGRRGRAAAAPRFRRSNRSRDDPESLQQLHHGPRVALAVRQEVRAQRSPRLEGECVAP